MRRLKPDLALPGQRVPDAGELRGVVDEDDAHGGTGPGLNALTLMDLTTLGEGVLRALSMGCQDRARYGLELVDGVRGHQMPPRRRARLRDRCAAEPGLVSRQISIGYRTILGCISKRGKTYLRTRFIRGARVIVLRPAIWPKYSFGPWLAAASRCMHRNFLAVALANNLARSAWSVLAGERCWKTRQLAA